MNGEKKSIVTIDGKPSKLSFEKGADPGTGSAPFLYEQVSKFGSCRSTLLGQANGEQPVPIYQGLWL